MWSALFSQTGSEIYYVSKKLGRFPDRIITNLSFDNVSKINSNLVKEYKGIWYFLPNKPLIQHYNECLGGYIGNLVTLHGFLRIIPPLICNSYEMYNGHPGDIELYPILKGFNPQEKAFNLKLPTSGSVIHKVTEGIDGGEIVASQTVSIQGLSLDEVYKTLHSNSVDLWYNFLKTKL